MQNQNISDMKDETRDKINNIVCWSILAGGAAYFFIRILIGIIAKFPMLFA